VSIKIHIGGSTVLLRTLRSQALRDLYYAYINKMKVCDMTTHIYMYGEGKGQCS